ncbi:ROK family transcriptional regulator [Amycolatopsis cihanbeyliensis]|uniref:Putative NBD/HSP70 family sugar kinase n=1 Tax=Amycolatopsis cihanbeyliensis TaxID=1128664 RepID=A0A542CTY0_AMYCI|nr:ROK family transcriptional regulator [Amycolatopsis cihanbeyliensis]TQI94282.1 putative NBD/HSP70 family sugar kinase [Amycolatopsis cihanbeyliensis]
MHSSPPAGQHTVRRHNCALVLRAISAAPGISRADVATRTGLAKATVSSLTERLARANLVTRTGPQSRAGRGRRGTGLALSTSGPHGLGLEIGVDYIATCLADPHGELHAHRVRHGDNRPRSVRQVLALAARAVRTALLDAGERGVPVGGVAVAVPGLVEAATGLLRTAPNLGWQEVDIAQSLRARTDLGTLPIVPGNEADFAASAELLSGGGDGPRDFVHVSGEVGIGAGIIIDGAVFRGVRGYAGEIGHLGVDPTGPECRCGARGCLERLAGQEQILRAAGIDGDTAEQELEILLRRLEAADPQTVAAVEAAGRWLGAGLANVVNAVDVPAVVLGGTYAILQPWLERPLRAELDRRVLSATWSPITVLRSRLGSEAAVRGAAAAAVRAILDDPEPYVAARERGTG